MRKETSYLSRDGKTLLHGWRHTPSDHPKAVAFAQSLTRDGLQEGTVVEMKMTAPDGTEKICNLRINEKDVALVAMLRELGNTKPQ